MNPATIEKAFEELEAFGARAVTASVRSRTILLEAWKWQRSNDRSWPAWVLAAWQGRWADMTRLYDLSLNAPKPPDQDMTN